VQVSPRAELDLRQANQRTLKALERPPIKPTPLPALQQEQRRIFTRRKPDCIKSVLLAIFIGYCAGWAVHRWLAGG
jgi:hypothetical protein